MVEFRPMLTPQIPCSPRLRPIFLHIEMRAQLRDSSFQSILEIHLIIEKELSAHKTTSFLQVGIIQNFGDFQNLLEKMSAIPLLQLKPFGFDTKKFREEVMLKICLKELQQGF